MRTVSAAAAAAMAAPQTGEVFLSLLTIDHDDLDAPIRLCNNGADVTSRGDLYVAFPFQHQLPTDSDGEVPRAEIAICNVTTEITRQLDVLQSPPTVALEIVLASSPDTVEAGPWNFTLKGVDYDQLTIQASLGFENVLSEPFPAPRFTPTSFPGLFNAVDR